MVTIDIDGGHRLELASLGKPHTCGRSWIEKWMSATSTIFSYAQCLALSRPSVYHEKPVGVQKACISRIMSHTGDVVLTASQRILLEITRSKSHARNHTLEITRSKSHARNHTLGITRSESHARNHTLEITRLKSHARNHTLEITRLKSHARKHKLEPALEILGPNSCYRYLINQTLC
jgi:hypothetical protein